MIARRNFLWASGALVLPAPAQSSATASGSPRLTGDGPVFLLGDEILEDYWKLERRYFLPKRVSREPIIRKDRNWEGMGPYVYGSVLRDPQDGLWKCWYTVFDNETYKARKPFPYHIAYAFSKDGLKWEKPNLGLVEFGNSRENNLVQIGNRDAEAIDVCLAPRDSGAPAKFVGITLDRDVRLNVSDDGFRWRELRNEPVDASHSDCHNSICYDSRARRWLVFLRPPVFAGPGHDKRRIAVMESKDLLHWSRPETVVIPDEQDSPEFYSMPVFQRGNLFFGFLQIYDRKRESLEIELTYSSDGYRWHRVPGKPIYLGTGPAGSFDSGMVTTADDIVIDGDRTLIYYGGWNGDHRSSTREAGIGCATAPRDRLIGWHASADAGYLLTKPCTIESTKLFVNAEVRGALSIALCNERGAALKGYGFDDCQPISGDSLRHPVIWKSGLESMRGRTLRIRVRIRDGAFFALETV